MRSRRRGNFEMTAPIGSALLPSLAGWQVLTKNGAAEKARFVKEPEVAREIEYFKANISKVVTPADLVKDRRLLGVVLEAYGLGGDVNSQARIRKVLEEGSLEPKALANKLVDPRYLELTKAFAFDLLGNAKLKDAEFVQSVVDRYTTAKFEGAVGDSNPALQRAMYFKRKMPTITSWFQVLADKALFEVVKTTLGLPTEFSKVDVDRQVDVLESKIGLNKLKDPAGLDGYAKRYLAIAAATQPGTSFNPAVEILNGISGGNRSLSTNMLNVLLQSQGLR
jgi:hypothetical protein